MPCGSHYHARVHPAGRHQRYRLSQQGGDLPPCCSRPSAETLLTIAADPKHLGARIGVTAVLHTWGIGLNPPPCTCKCIVPRRRACPWMVPVGMACKAGFFLPVRVLSRLFRRLLLEQLSAISPPRRSSAQTFFGLAPDTSPMLALEGDCSDSIAPHRVGGLCTCARSFGPEAVLAYLSRYTHRVAIKRTAASLPVKQTRRHLQVATDYRAKAPDRHKTMTLAKSPEFSPALSHPCLAQRLPPASGYCRPVGPIK